MTEQAASRVLNATDIAKPLQDELLARSEVAAQPLGQDVRQPDVGGRVQGAGRRYARLLRRRRPRKIKATNEQLTEIMMAQDFQDLTGQVIKKVVDMVQELEAQLLQVLIEADAGASARRKCRPA